MIHKGVVLTLAVVLLFIFSAITQAEEEYSVDQIKKPRPRCCQWGAGRCLRLCYNVEEVSTLKAYEEAGKRGEPQYSVEQNVGGRRCCVPGRNRSCMQWCGPPEIGGGLRYSVDQTGGFHCCIPGAFGNCMQWCIKDEKMAALEEGGGTQYSMDQYPGRRCCSWGPRNRCVRWC